jgi:hypothetical protein
VETPGIDGISTTEGPSNSSMAHNSMNNNRDGTLFTVGMLTTKGKTTRTVVTPERDVNNSRTPAAAENL